jgi:cyclophilin family peptidyl-prolyl cis-trans isomerase
MKTWIILLIFILAGCKEDPLQKQTYSPVTYEAFRVNVKEKDTYTGKLPEKPAVYAVLTTSEGEIVLELFDRDAPKTVQNFIELAQGTKESIGQDGKSVKKRFYDGLTFHRVINGFMIQGGCPLGNGTGGPGYKFEDEINGVWLGLNTLNGEQVPYYDRFVQEIVIREMGVRSQEELEKRAQEFEEKFKKVKKLSILEVLHRVGYRFNEVVKSHQSTRGRIAMANSGPNTNGSQFFINQVDTPHLNGLHTVFGEVVNGMDVVDKIAQKDKPSALGEGDLTETKKDVTMIQKVLIIDRR